MIDQIEILKRLQAGYAADKSLLDDDMIDLMGDLDFTALLALIEPKPMKQMIGEIEAMLRHRNTSGATASEADFVAGAMTAIQTILPHEPNQFVPGIPPMWTIAPLSGRPVLADCPAPKRSEFVVGVIFKGPFETQAEAEAEAAPDAEIIEIVKEF